MGAVVSGVMSPLIWVIAIVTLPHEPPSVVTLQDHVQRAFHYRAGHQLLCRNVTRIPL